MAIETILSQIDAEIERLQQVRKLLTTGTAVTAPAAKTPGRKTRVAKKAKGKRVLSPEARKRIGDAQKRRWAAQRKTKKDA